MSKAWAVVVISLVACSTKKDPPSGKGPIVREEDMGVAKPAEPKRADEIAVDQIPTPNDPLPGASAPTPPHDPATDPKPECVDEGTIVSFDPNKLKACFDSNEDGQADRCVTWRRDGKVQTIDTVFAVEDSTVVEETPEVVDYRSDTENNDDERITLDYSSVNICPYDRACMKIMPKVMDTPNGDGEIQHVLADPDFKRGVLVIKQNSGEKGAFEIWDLASGRMRARFPMKRLVADEYYDFNAVIGSGVVIATAENTSDAKSLGTIFGIEGGSRGELAQGSRNLDMEMSFTHAGTFGVVDVGTDEEKPYTLYLHSLSSGASVGKFTIKRLPDGISDLTFHKLKNGFVAATQWGEKVRIDMIDLKSRSNRVLFVPGC